MQQKIKELMRNSIETKQKILRDEGMIANICDISERIFTCLAKGGKVLLCGNGGSASDALHIAGEFVGRFQKERKSIPAIALNADVASMTSIANDYGYEKVFSRVLEGLMTDKDVLIGISTSGNSENVYRAILAAKEIGGISVALLGKDGGKIKEVADYSLIVPSDCTARIQESHIMIGHIICELVENSICGGDYE